MIGHKRVREHIDQGLIYTLGVHLQKGPSFIFRQEVPHVCWAGMVSKVEEELESSVIVIVGEDAHLVHAAIEHVVCLARHQRLLP